MESRSSMRQSLSCASGITSKSHMKIKLAAISQISAWWKLKRGWFPARTIDSLRILTVPLVSSWTFEWKWWRSMITLLVHKKFPATSTVFTLSSSCWRRIPYFVSSSETLSRSKTAVRKASFSLSSFILVYSADFLSIILGIRLEGKETSLKSFSNQLCTCK